MSDDWTMGATAAYDDYKPLGNDPWTNTIAPQWTPPEGTAFASPNAKRADARMASIIAPDRGMAFGAMTPQEETIALPERAKAAVDMAVPQSPLDLGLMLATGPGRMAYKMGSLAAGAALDPSDAEAGAGRLIRDPRLWSPLSAQKLRKPLDEMAHQYTDIRVPEQKIVDPASLVGGYGLLTPWDLSAANRTVTHIDDVKLPRPVTAHGGVGFPEANPGMAAASDLGISRRLDNSAAELSKTGKPVYIMPMTMSETGIDASHHVADPLSQLVKQAPIKAEDAAAFNAMMRDKLMVRNKDGSIKKAPDWVDTTDPGFEDFIKNLQGGMRTKALMADRMALAEWQNKGFPDVAAIRHAMTEPGLIGLPRNTTGMTISRYIPGQGLLDTTHPSYRSGVAGQHMGQLAQLTPFDVGAPDIAKGLAEVNAANKAAGKTSTIQPAYHMGKPTEGVPIAQEFTPEWLDNLMKSWGER